MRGLVRGSIFMAVVLLVSACSAATPSPTAPAPTPTAPTSAAPTSAASATSALPQSAKISEIQKNGVLRAGVAIALPWLGQDPKTSEYFGPGTTIAQLIADRLGVKVQYVPQDWSVIVAAIQADQIDIAVAGLYATPARLKVVNMTNYDVGGYCWAVLKTNDKINSLSDLNSPNVTMAQQEGGGTYQITAAAYPLAKQLTRLPLPGEEANITEVLSGKADTAPFDSSLALAYEQVYSQLKVIPSDCQTNPDQPTPVAVAYTLDDQGYKQFVDQIVTDNKAAIGAVIQKYHDPQYYLDAVKVP